METTVRREIVRFETRLVGIAPAAIPPLILLGFAALGAIARRQAQLVTVGLESAVPLAAGIVAASLIAREPSLELQLGMPGGYRPAALRRLAILFAWSALASLAGWIVADAAGLVAAWGPNEGPVAAQLTWLVPLAFFVAIGGLAAVVLRGRATAVGVLAILWFTGHLFHGGFETIPYFRAWYPFLTSYAPTAADWLATRLTLLAIAGVAFAALAASLRAGEWLLASEDA